MGIIRQQRIFRLFALPAKNLVVYLAQILHVLLVIQQENGIYKMEIVYVFVGIIKDLTVKLSCVILPCKPNEA